MAQQWHDVLFLHWAIEPAVAAPLLPTGTVPDVFDGLTYAGLIAFRIARLGWPGGPHLPYVGTFAETNVRLYSVDAQGRRAVVFLSMDAERLLAVVTARAALRLPYQWSRMHVGHAGDVRTYRSTRNLTGSSGPAVAEISIHVGPPISEPTALEHFLTARWALHTRAWGRTLHLPVEHPRWPLHHAELLSHTDTLLAAAGLPAPAGPPDSVLYSPGVPVVFGVPDVVCR